mmetsp:Transcript_44438/g.96621  ORF Transcript_44438/g.96621 Transcript_44438/m.96621 type:complete len:208 (+) Transcript_44438:222-845(+)
MLNSFACALVLNQNDHGAVIVVLITVVSRGEDRKKLPASEVFVAVLHAFVSADDEPEAIATVELLHTVRPEAAGVLPAGRCVHSKDTVVLRGIRPQCVQDHTFPSGGALGDFPNHLDGFGDAPEVLQRGNGVADATMDTEDCSFHEGCNGKKLEDIVHALPDILTLVSEFPQAVRLETVVHVHEPVLVIASYKEDLGRVQYLQGKQE